MAGTLVGSNGSTHYYVEAVENPAWARISASSGAKWRYDAEVYGSQGELLRGTTVHSLWRSHYDILGDAYDVTAYEYSQYRYNFYRADASGTVKIASNVDWYVLYLESSGGEDPFEPFPSTPQLSGILTGTTLSSDGTWLAGARTPDGMSYNFDRDMKVEYYLHSSKEYTLLGSGVSKVRLEGDAQGNPAVGLVRDTNPLPDMWYPDPAKPGVNNTTYAKEIVTLPTGPVPTLSMTPQTVEEADGNTWATMCFVAVAVATLS